MLEMIIYIYWQELIRISNKDLLLDINVSKLVPFLSVYGT